MTMKRKGFAALAAIFVFIPLAAHANPVTPRERQNCRADYKAYCNKYPIGSQTLLDCMRRNAKKLANNCVEALYYAGEMTRSQAEQLIHRK